MNVVVENVRDGDAGERIVRVCGRTGSLEGLARPRGRVLQIARSYGLELTLNYPLLVGENVWPTREREYRTSFEDGSNSFVGEVDGVDSDGVLYFRLGVDSLTLLAIQPVPRPGDWLRIVVPSTGTELYLTGQ